MPTLGASTVVGRGTIVISLGTDSPRGIPRISLRTTRAPFFAPNLPRLQRLLTIPCRHPLMLKFQGLSVRLTVLTAFLTIARADGFQGTEEKVGCFVDCLITPRTTITRAFTHSDQMPWRQHHLGFSRQRRKRLHCFLGMSDHAVLAGGPTGQAASEELLRASLHHYHHHHSCTLFVDQRPWGIG